MFKSFCTVGAVAAALWTAAPQPADACGGTFCDQPPVGSPMPVDQTGETILFVVADGFVEAHVQIEYDGGDASQFAWLVPVPAIPEFEVGSFRLVDNVLDATVPIYGFERETTCDGPGGGGGFISNPDAGGGEEPPPTVVAAQTVGAFDVVVLKGGTSQSIGEWLAANDFAQDAEAPEILDEYLDEGFFFAAFRLSHAEGIEDIHPVVIRYPGDMPCIPLRLTRIAAVDDMPIRALVLGEARAFPVGYDHVQLNRVRLDWNATGANYTELVSMAVDEAGGRAFVTEYAGTSSMIDTEGLDASALNADTFETLPAANVLVELESQGLVSCLDECTFSHELIEGLLLQHLPPPAGVNPADFYPCPECFGGVDEDAWDGEAFAADFQERIVEPMLHASDLLETWPYITRLFTTISPHEMLSDPTFEEIPELADVPNRHGAQRIEDCCAWRMRLPGGREVVMPDFIWPQWDDEMPWAERVSEYQPEGPPSEIITNSALIDDLLEAHSDAVGCGSGGTGGSGGGEADDDDDDDGDANADGDDGGPGGGPGGGGSDATGGTGGGEAGVGDDDSSSSCACRTDSPGRGGVGWLGLGLLGWVARRRW